MSASVDIMKILSSHNDGNMQQDTVAGEEEGYELLLRA